MTAHEIVAKARKLPDISPAALSLTQLLNDPASDFDEVAAVIKTDGLLTAKLLRACNSSVFGLAERVASVDQALLLLGFDEVRRLALSIAFGNVMAAPLANGATEPNPLWQHSFLAATAGESIVGLGLYQEVNGSVAFTTGLLHDIGKLIMAQVITAEAQAVILKHMNAEGLGSVEAEREVLGTDHAEVGACLLHIWRLPENIVEAVANHHRPVLKPAPQLSALAHLANRFAHLSEPGSNAQAYQFQPEEKIVQAFELNERDSVILIAEIQRHSERARELQAIL
ncbi:MAG: HDOD domain-containing protein [Akkermansiaceae bacterium]|nr:HDOD domain-containing protein [Verrucomicrobiales bacterium]